MYHQEEPDLTIRRINNFIRSKHKGAMMNTKDAYKQKLEAELELARAKVSEFKAKARNFSADNRIETAKHLEELERGVETAKSKLKELGEAGEDGWEKIRDGVEHAMKALHKVISDVGEKFKGR